MRRGLPDDGRAWRKTPRRALAETRKADSCSPLSPSVSHPAVGTCRLMLQGLHETGRVEDVAALGHGGPGVGGGAGRPGGPTTFPPGLIILARQLTADRALHAQEDGHLLCCDAFRRARVGRVDSHAPRRPPRAPSLSLRRLPGNCEWAKGVRFFFSCLLFVYTHHAPALPCPVPLPCCSLSQSEKKQSGSSYRACSVATARSKAARSRVAWRTLSNRTLSPCRVASPRPTAPARETNLKVEPSIGGGQIRRERAET